VGVKVDITVIAADSQ